MLFKLFSAQGTFSLKWIKIRNIAIKLTKHLCHSDTVTYHHMDRFIVFSYLLQLVNNYFSEFLNLKHLCLQ